MNYFVSQYIAVYIVSDPACLMTSRMGDPDNEMAAKRKSHGLANSYNGTPGHLPPANNNRYGLYNGIF